MYLHSCMTANIHVSLLACVHSCTHMHMCMHLVYYPPGCACKRSHASVT